MLSGVPSVFLRLAGCRLACPWCDTPYARHSLQGREMTLEEVIQAINQAAGGACRHCVITGGEPLLQAAELSPLTRVLTDLGRHVTIETAAVDPPPAGLSCHLASLSPKLANALPPEGAGMARGRPARSLPEVAAALAPWLAGHTCQLKFVIRDRDDVREVVSLLELVRPRPAPDQVLLMPEGTTAEALSRHAPAAIEGCLVHGFRYCDRLQVRLFGRRRGV